MVKVKYKNHYCKGTLFELMPEKFNFKVPELF
jgi:hypothetical protein